MHWRRKWQPTPVFLPRESQGQGRLEGCCLCGHTESDTTEVTQQQQQQQDRTKLSLDSRVSLGGNQNPKPITHMWFQQEFAQLLDSKQDKSLLNDQATEEAGMKAEGAVSPRGWEPLLKV